MAAVLVLTVALLPLLRPTASFSADDAPELTKLEIIDLLKARRFQTLEAYMTSQSWDREEGCCLRGLNAFKHSDPRNKEPLDAWVAEQPNSVAALLARGTFHFHVASLSRGGAYSSRTDLRRFARMNEFLRLSVADMKAALRKEPRLAEAYSSLIASIRLGGRRSELDQIFRAAMEALPDSPKIHRQYLFALQEKWGGSPGEYAAYKDMLKRRYSGQPGFTFLDPPDPTMAAGRQAKSDGDFANALRLFTAAIEQRPTAKRYKARASVYFKLQGYDRGVADLNAAVRLSPNSASLQIQRMHYLFKAEKYQKAREAIDLAIALDPYHPENLMDREDFLTFIVFRSLQLKDVRAYVEAKNELERTLDAATHYGDDWHLLYQRRGFYWLGRNQLDRAVQEFETAVSLPLADAETWRGYSTALFYVGDCSAIQAGDTYVRLCESDPDCPLNLNFINVIRKNLAPWCERPQAGPPPRIEKPLNFPGTSSCTAFFQDLDEFRALEACLKKADAGDSGAQMDMGFFHLQGQMGFQSFERAAEWFERAAAGGQADALALLGGFHLAGSGVPRDRKKGLELIRAAAAKGSKEGFYLLGRAHFLGAGVPHDEAKAKEYFGRAARLGHQLAETYLNNTMWTDETEN